MLPSVKLQQNYKRNPGEVSKREVRVSEGSSYRESTVSTSSCSEQVARTHPHTLLNCQKKCFFPSRTLSSAEASAGYS